MPELDPQKILADFREAPIGKTLVSCFEALALPPIQAKEHYGPQLLADVNVPDLHCSMVFKGTRTYHTLEITEIHLEFHDQPLKYLENPPSTLGHFATFSAGLARTGSWTKFSGAELKPKIRVNFNQGVDLPTRRGLWILGIAHKFALASSEHNLSLYDQPTYWSSELWPQT